MHARARTRRPQRGADARQAALRAGPGGAPRAAGTLAARVGASVGAALTKRAHEAAASPPTAPASRRAPVLGLACAAAGHAAEFPARARQSRSPDRRSRRLRRRLRGEAHRRPAAAPCESAMASVEQKLWNIFTYYTLHGNPLDPEHMRVSALC